MSDAHARLGLARLVGAGVLIASLAAAITVVAFVANGSTRGNNSRGTLVHLGRNLAYDEGVFCVPYHHFCVVEPPDGQAPVAFYTFTTHAIFREQGCEVAWEPDRVFDGGNSGSVRGVFHEGCGGATFDRTGQRVFGPAPRSLDRFEVTVSAEFILVDTRKLICEGTVSATSTPCVRAPRSD